VSILGTRVLRTEDPRFLTTGGVYTDDLRLPGAWHVHFVRSAVAHARIKSVDVSAALAERGVIVAFTGADLDLAELDLPMAGMISAQMSQQAVQCGPLLGGCPARW
jgi:CO/xanthine dehydrogenase Mo-binding subunit